MEYFDANKEFRKNNMSMPNSLHVRRLENNRQLSLAEEEIQLRIQKLEEAIQQQRELHEKRMQIAETEYKVAVLKLLEAEEQTQLRANKL
ncbi:hypothetical protein Trydic_g8503 [Trypoxylus dichotomus]